jgi:hypothetical protein
MRDNALEKISDAAEPSVARTTPSYSPQVNRENPGSTDASGNRSAPAAPPNRWRRPLLILGPVALIVGALVLYLATGRYVTEEESTGMSGLPPSWASAAAASPIDAYPDTSVAARVTTLAPASGSVFALLPPQNATGNWVKVVQRIPVRLSFDQALDHLALRAGMSVKVSIDTGHQRSLRELWRDLTTIFGA